MGSHVTLIDSGQEAARSARDRLYLEGGFTAPKAGGFAFVIGYVVVVVPSVEISLCDQLGDVVSPATCISPIPWTSIPA